MADADELCETIMRELHDVVISESGDVDEELEELTFQQDTVSDDIPPSLLSYFETSKSRAARSEKFILEELEDFTASRHTEDMKKLPNELDKDMMKKQVTFDTENESISSAETEALFSHNLSVCPDSEDEAETDEYVGPGLGTIQSSEKEEQIKNSTESHREHREKRHCEEMKTEEKRRQRHRDFQEELKKIMEAEKLHQRELELMKKRAQEKLEEEFLLKQELICNLQKQVEEEKKMREEEQKRFKEEGEKKRKEEEEKRRREDEDRRKKEDEIIKRERKRMEEQMRRKKEEKRKMEEIKLKEEIRRKREEEQRKTEEEEKRRFQEEEKGKKEEEQKMIQEDMRKKEEERKINETRLKEEGKMRQIEEEERERKENEEKIKERDKSRKSEEETKAMDKMMAKKMEEDKRRKNEEEMVKEWQKKEKQDSKNSNEDNKKREEERKIAKELEVRTKTEEVRKKVEERRIEEKGKNMEEEMMMAKQMNKKEGEDKDIEEMQLKEDGEKRKKEHNMEFSDKKKEEVKTTEEDKRPWQEQEMRTQKEEEEHNSMEKEIRVKKEMEQNRDKRKMEPEVKTKDDVRRNKADKWRIKEDVRKDKEEEMQMEERGLKGEEETNNFGVQDAEKEERLKLQEKKRDKDGLKSQNKTKNIKPTSSCTVSLQSECTVGASSSENVQQLDPNKNILYTSTSQTMKQQDADVSPRSSSCPLPVCLPEHTEQKRLSWMRDCIPWSRLSLQNKSKQKVHVRSRRGLRRASEACSLPPVCPQTLLQSPGCRSLQEVTTVTLEDLPGCSFVTLAQCPQLQSLTLRRCGLKSLEGINQLPQLRYIDVQGNDISFVDCENMASLQVLRLGHNKLTSIHGLSGAENLNVLDLSHNSITRIAGLESIRRLQSLSLDHNQLISTKGLRDTYTLLHLDCSHNHLAGAEGVENCALLQTLDLRSNSLTEPPSLNNHILLRELHLDDNSISSLQGLAVCWLPLMHHLSAAENRITLLPSLSDFVSLTNLDLRFNCMSELQNVCEGVEGCLFLQEVHLSGNPLQQEIGWRSTLQKAVAGLRAIDGEETDSFLSAPAAQQLSLASGSFLTLCQAQLKQIRDLQQQHSRELSNASAPLDAVKRSCRHFTETLKLAVDQRLAHEYGDTVVSAGQTMLEETLDMDSAAPKKLAEHSEIGSTEKAPPVIPNRNNTNWTLEEKLSFSHLGLHSLATMETTTSSQLKVAPVSNHPDLDSKNTAAVVIQQRWRKYRQKCGNISSPPTAEKGGERGGDGGTPESGPSDVDRSVVGQDYAATIIQAFWRGFALRRRLETALAAVTCPDSGEDEAFEEVDVDGFVFDEAALEKHWTLPLSEESSFRHQHGSEQPLSLKYTLPPTPSWRPKQAWVAGEQVDSTGMEVSPESSIRSKSPASTAALSGLSARSEKIVQEWGFHDSNTALLMLKRAQKMRSKKQQQNKYRDPSVCLALFRNCKYQQAPVEARNRPAPHNRNHVKVCRAKLDLEQAEQTEQVTQERAQQWLHTQSDRDSESEHFLPEISSVVLNGGRVQLVADPAHAERLHHASGLWASSSLVSQPCKERNYPCSNSLGHARKEVLSPQRVQSAPTRRERISLRDNPVQLSGGWGGGKKRDKVYK
ncbi:leucine-rich repeat and IQ domain-containing protein 1 isoform X2 [Hippoglossus stenolepis]|uniref:leucine-rich repeat and IQ domain-containing protein 1 isoform X2 n=1 Tax=Hippoglossus stenolepis TaxID=195615 RepID=UPI001FAF6C3D|nr:leucine-rich repeat and IQ domain-containing protein 1 isoform X2 [Hippoglossus stenolepis]